MRIAWLLGSWLMIGVLALAAAFAVDAVVALVLFVHLPASWDLTGRYFTLAVPLGQTMVLVPVLAAGAVFGVFRPARMLAFVLVAMAYSSYLLLEFKNPPLDVARQQLSLAVVCAVAFGLVWWLRQAARVRRSRAA